MSRTVVVRPEAERDIDQLADFLGQAGREAGARFYRAVQQGFRQLAEMPHLGAPYDSATPELASLRCWRVPGFRNHINFYMPIPEGIRVIRVLHGARNLDELLGSPDVE